MSYQLIIGIGVNRDIAMEKFNKIKKQGFRPLLGVGITEQWDTEYCISFNCTKMYAKSLMYIWEEDSILYDNRLIFADKKEGINLIKKKDIQLGHKIVSRRAGNIEDYFNKENSNALLKAEKTQNLTILQNRYSKGLTVIKYE